MKSATNPQTVTAMSRATSLARCLLTAERVLMGLVLLGFGLSGFLNLLPEAGMPEGAAQFGSALMHAGFAYPLLKGAEVLLELYVGSSHRRNCSPNQPLAAASDVQAFRLERATFAARSRRGGPQRARRQQGRTSVPARACTGNLAGLSRLYS